ncbi:MAG: GLUG motif-containing protein [Lachnospiraceae bacterium]|nr:GLUG motif-containing protein [Lachnospiraceae bacterium]
MSKNTKKALSCLIVFTMCVTSSVTMISDIVLAAPNKNEKHIEKTSETPEIEVVYETGTQNNAKTKREDTEKIKTEDDGSYEVIIPTENGIIEVDETNNIKEDEIEWEDLHIKSAEDFSEFAKKCSLDAWSRNKNVYLDEDITLTGVECNNVPTFGGHFYGKDHEIAGYTMYGSKSYTGLFDYVQEGAVIESLVVKAAIRTDGKQIVTGGVAGENRGEIRNCVFDGTLSGENYVGGIAGYNELTGNIINCKSKGTITGAYYTGGIAGENVGNISSSVNEANINTVVTDHASSIQDFDIATYTDGILSKLTGNQSEKKQSPSLTDSGSVDTGGIAGLSIGVIQFCDNVGEVGYEHVGYNVGGIVGRQSGYVHGCNNEGTVKGRKDVGGITGQAEPYVVADFTEDVITKLSDNINKLHDVIDDTLSDAGTSSDTISSRLSVVKQFADSAINETSFLSNSTIDWTNGMVGAGNELMSRAQFIMSETSKNDGPLDSSRDAMNETKDAAKDLDNALKDMDIYERMNDTDKQKYDAAKERELYLTGTQGENVTKVTGADRTRLIFNNSIDSTYSLQDGPLMAYKADGETVVDVASLVSEWNKEPNVTVLAEVIKWTHQDGTEHNANCEKGDGNITSDANSTLNSEVEKTVIEESAYALTYDMYTDPSKGGYVWSPVTENPYVGSDKKKTVNKEIEIQSRVILDSVSPYVTDATNDASKDARKAADNLQKAARNMEDAGSQTKSIISDVASRGGISMPSLGDDYRNATNALNAALKGMSDNMGALNDEMSNSSDIMIADMGDVNDQFSVIMQLYTDAIDGVLDGDYSDNIEDSSMEVAKTCVDATIADCKNTGKIEGDLDVAGIAGAMGVEYDFDLESDITRTKDTTFNATYQSKCVLRNNKNDSHVTAQKSYVGGICGLQEIGTILSCENYGKVKSNSSDYVGGISGNSLSYIQKSVSKCFLSGKNYIGGIAGHGNNILNCYAMVDIYDDEADSYYGAIAGAVTDEGKIHYNYFVSDKFAGIDRVSYKGQAEPIDYNTFISIDTIPVECRKLYAIFYIDDIETDRIETVYGGSISSDQFPSYVSEEGTYCKWNYEDLENMTFDVEVEGEYTRYITSLASDQLRENGQSALLVDGTFRDGDKLSSTLWGDNDAPLENVIEHWELTIPSSTNERHTVRYSKPENVDTDVEMYINNAGRWDKLETGVFGGYITFEVSGAHAELAVVKLKKNYTKIIIISIIATLTVLGIITIIIRSVRKRKASINDKENVDSSKTEKAEGEEKSVGSDDSTGDLEIIDIDKNN